LINKTVISKAQINTLTHLQYVVKKFELSLLYPGDRGSRALWNIGTFSPVVMASHLRRRPSA